MRIQQKTQQMLASLIKTSHAFKADDFLDHQNSMLFT